jgi:hypothetical protein
MRQLISMLLLATFLGFTAHASAQTRPAEDELKQQIETLRKQMDDGPGAEWDHHAFAALVKALSELPKADERRVAALDLAGRFARADELSSHARTNADYRRDHFRLNVAWTILQTLQVLREGMPAEDLVPILGKPTKVYDLPAGEQTWRWYYGSPMHVNPGLDIRIKNNVVLNMKEIRA